MHNTEHLQFWLPSQGSSACRRSLYRLLRVLHALPKIKDFRAVKRAKYEIYTDFIRFTVHAALRITSVTAV